IVAHRRIEEFDLCAAHVSRLGVHHLVICRVERKLLEALAIAPARAERDARCGMALIRARPGLEGGRLAADVELAARDEELAREARGIGHVLLGRRPTIVHVVVARFEDGRRARRRTAAQRLAARYPTQAEILGDAPLLF